MEAPEIYEKLRELFWSDGTFEVMSIPTAVGVAAKFADEFDAKKWTKDMVTPLASHLYQLCPQ
jgi:hypothetical protein